MFISDSGVNVHFEWPASRQPLEIARRLTAEAPLRLYVDREPGGDYVAFFREGERPVMLNRCVYSTCRQGEAELAFDSITPLYPKSRIQVGHFRLAFTAGDSESAGLPPLASLVAPASRWLGAEKLPEVEEILPNGGSYINDQRYFNDIVLARDNGGDVLKMLEVEYKRFLIWQEQGVGDFNPGPATAEPIIRTDDRFERVREQTKDKTLTECIIDSAFLMEKLWPELEAGELSDDLFAVDEKSDLLRLLSPDHAVAKRKFNVPELVFRDLRKTGLDTYY